MNIWDIPFQYLAVGLVLWVTIGIFFLWKSQYIGAAVIAFFFFGQVILDLVLKNQSIPNGQLLIIIFGPLLVLSVMFRQKVSAKGRNLIPLLFFGTAIVFSIIWNGLSFWDLKSDLVPVIFAVIIYYSISDLLELKLLLSVFAGFVVVSTIVAGMQFTGHESFYLPSQLLQADAGGFKRGIGLASHFSQTGLYCAAAIPLAVMGALSERSKLKKLVWVMVGLFAMAGLAFTALRAGLIAGLVGATYALFMWNWRKAIPLLIAGIIAVTVVAVTLPFLRGASSALIEHTSNVDDSARMRPVLIEMGLGLWKESPLFGIGPKGVARAEGGAGDPHNTYINVLVNYGLFGLLFFIMIPVLGYRKLRMAIRVLPQHRDIFIGLAGALLTGYIVAIVHSVNYIPLFWLFPALALSVDRVRSGAKMPFRQMS